MAHSIIFSLVFITTEALAFTCEHVSSQNWQSLYLDRLASYEVLPTTKNLKIARVFTFKECKYVHLRSMADVIASALANIFHTCLTKRFLSKYK